MAQNKDNTLVKNASFLMVAALVSKIIGMLYKSPLSTILGSESYALFQYAQNAYFILLMIASFSIPQAVSKVMAEKIAFGRYRDAQKVFRCALLYAVIAGGAVSLFCVFGAGIMVPDSMAGARLALRFLAPTIFLSGILGVFRGYFQAYRRMMPTSLSQIIEQIFVAVIALLMSGVMVSHFASQGEQAAQEWGAAGATLGTGAGVLSALLFMLFVYRVNKKLIQKRIRRDRVSRNEATGTVMREIIVIIMPIILSAFIYNVNGFINSYMYSGISGYRGIESSLIKTLYAEYGYYMTLINIPLTLASTAPTSMIPEVSAHYALGDLSMTREKIHRATWISMLISIPSAVGLAVLAGPITSLIFPGTNGVGAQLMMLGAVTIILNGNSNISNGVLQGIGKPNIPMVNAALALAADVVSMALLMTLTDLGIYAVVAAMIIYAVVMCLLNEFAMRRYLKYKNPWRSAYINPMIAAIPMGLAAALSYRLLYSLSGSNALSLLVSVVLAVMIYFLVYLIVSHPSEEEFALIPGGRYLKKLYVRLPGALKNPAEKRGGYRKAGRVREEKKERDAGSAGDPSKEQEPSMESLSPGEEKAESFKELQELPGAGSGKEPERPGEKRAGKAKRGKESGSGLAAALSQKREALRKRMEKAKELDDEYLSEEDGQDYEDEEDFEIRTLPAFSSRGEKKARKPLFKKKRLAEEEEEEEEEEEGRAAAGKGPELSREGEDEEEEESESWESAFSPFSRRKGGRKPRRRTVRKRNRDLDELIDEENLAERLNEAGKKHHQMPKKLKEADESDEDEEFVLNEFHIDLDDEDF